MDVSGRPGDERRVRLSEELKARGGLRPFAESCVTHEGNAPWDSSLRDATVRLIQSLAFDLDTHLPPLRPRTESHCLGCRCGPNVE